MNLDFDSIADPQQLPDFLRRMAEACAESADSWETDVRQAHPWRLVQRELISAADAIAQRLAEHYKGT